MSLISSYGTLFIFAQLVSLALVSCTQPVFTLKDSYIGDDFFHYFNFSTVDDPTHGRVVSLLPGIICGSRSLILSQELCVSRRGNL